MTFHTTFKACSFGPTWRSTLGSYQVSFSLIASSLATLTLTPPACAPLLRSFFSICISGPRSKDYNDFKPSHKQFFGGKLHSNMKESTRQRSFPSLLAPTKFTSKWTSSSGTSTRGSSHARSTMESRATVHPTSVLDDHEYYQVPVTIPETVFENPGHMAAEDLRLYATKCSDDIRSRYESSKGVEGVEGQPWDIWAGPGESSAYIPKPLPAVYPGDQNLQDNPNLRFLTVHDAV